jgi:hypothetical protein
VRLEDGLQKTIAYFDAKLGETRAKPAAKIARARG